MEMMVLFIHPNLLTFYKDGYNFEMGELKISKGEKFNLSP